MGTAWVKKGGPAQQLSGVSSPVVAFEIVWGPAVGEEDGWTAKDAWIWELASGRDWQRLVVMAWMDGEKQKRSGWTFCSRWVFLGVNSPVSGALQGTLGLYQGRWGSGALLAAEVVMARGGTV